MSPSLGEIDGARLPIERNGWVLREEDFTLYAMLSDPVYMPEVVWKDPTNHEYGGAYRVHPEQYQINRCEEQTAVFACGRATGKTMGQKSHSQVHCFTSPAEDMLITAPELIHLLPLTDAVEDSIRESRLLSECLDKDYGKTGFTHRPFGTNFSDGTKLVGRIPKLKGPQPLNAKILTPNGWTTMGDVEVGQTVIGSDETVTEVVDVTEVWENDTYRICFWGGSGVEADGEHLWPVEAAGESIGLKSTQQIADHLAQTDDPTDVRELWAIPALSARPGETVGLPVQRVEPVGRKQVRCIKVGAENGLYVTDDYVLTHNTGVLGQHSPFVMVEEAQNFPDPGWKNLEEAQPIDSPILTPYGFLPMGDIEPGDLVIGSNGKPTLVTAVLPQGLRDVLQVEFTDGSVVECDQHHLWKVICNRYRAEDKWRILTTADLETAVQKKGRSFGSRNAPWCVPRLSGPVQFKRGVPKPLVDPYLLGLILGDGCTRQGSVTFTCEDEEVVSEFRARLDPEEELVAHGNRGIDYRVRGRNNKGRFPVPLNTRLRELGVWGCGSEDKFVPEEYLYGSPASRLALLQGLMDTDGHITDEGAAHYSTISSHLAEAVRFIVWSLGGRLSYHRRLSKGGRYPDSHVVYFHLPRRFPPCLLARKASRVKIPKRESLQRGVVAVRRGAKKQMKCIEVAAADGLYVTQDFVVTHNCINYDATDKDGSPRWRYWAFGVHDGNRQSGFSSRAKNEEWKVIQVTRLQRADWGKEAKERAKASYGSTSSPDYRRNILGEPGDAASAYFVTARLLSCCDQKVERGEVKGSDYNTKEYQHQLFRAEELDEVKLHIADALDLPHGYQSVYGGVDVGLNRSPTVISLFTETMVAGKLRLKLFRRFTLERFRSKQIRQALYAIDLHFGGALMGMGVDSTGLGLPLMQEMEDDEICPPHLMQVMRGYFFSSKVAVAVAPENVYRDAATGIVKDQYGRMLEEQTLPDGSKRFIVWAPFITASTNYLARWVDTGYLMLPFDQEVIQDMLGETKERVERLQSNAERAGGALRKPDIFHILDSFRGMAMSYHATDIEEAMAIPQQRPVFDEAF